jgi:hypothetical protein
MLNFIARKLFKAPSATTTTTTDSTRKWIDSKLIIITMRQWIFCFIIQIY